MLCDWIVKEVNLYGDLRIRNKKQGFSLCIMGKTREFCSARVLVAWPAAEQDDPMAPERRIGVERSCVALVQSG